MPRRSLPIVLLWLWFTHLPAAALVVSDIPDALKPWREWVLWQEQTHACPILATDQNPRACVWPTSLQLNLTDQGGIFTLKVKSFADLATVLPGDEAHWPQDVTVNGEPFPVMGAEGRPTAFLPPGAHNISGRFLWERPPSVLTVPNHIGLIELTFNHQPVPWPTLNEHGQLWLAEDDTGLTASSNANTMVRMEPPRVGRPQRKYRPAAAGPPNRPVAEAVRWTGRAGEPRSIVRPPVSC